MTENNLNKWAIGIGGTFLAILVMWGISQSSPQQQIKKAVQEQIRADLLYESDKASITVNNIEIWGDDKDYADVEGVIEAYNGFGTKITSDFVAELTKGDSGWELDGYDMEFDDDLEDFDW